jgi:exopolyphosphatase/guanosine-5'-triphosphate,3'-diphosphate pyrophosphatase
MKPKVIPPKARTPNYSLSKTTAHPRRGFPLRVAAIDMGSNAIRFVAAEFISSSQYIVLESERAPVRLGAGTFSAGRLTPPGMEKAFQALARFKERMRILKIEHYRAVATSAVRESSNGREFAGRARAELNLDLEIIGGSEETQLVYRAVKPQLRMGKKPWLLANLGGGSLEVALVNQSGVLMSETHTIGAVRLWEEFKASAQNAKQFLRLLEEYVSTLRLSLGDAQRPWAGFLATGGNIEELAKMAGAPEDSRGSRVLSLNDLQQLLAALPRMSLKQRMTRWGIYPDRADVVLPAAVVYSHLCLLSGQTQMIVPYAGTKEGLLFDLVDRLTLSSAYRLRQEEQLMNLAVSLGRRYQFDEAHGRQVCRLALALFEQLQALHGLGPEDQRVLLVAALLHDIGAYISYKKHHKHSLYLIAQSELPGFGPDDMLMAANVARYHRKNVPQPEHENFSRLTKIQRLRVTKLASLLRIADALDRDHAQTIRKLSVRVRKPYLDIKLGGKGFRELEHWALQNKAQLFTQVFGLRVRIVN